MRCNQCRKKLSKHEKICGHCGVVVEQPKRRWLWVLTIVVLVAVICGVFAFNFYGESKKDNVINAKTCFENAYANETQKTFMNSITIEFRDLNSDAQKATIYMTLPDLTKGNSASTGFDFSKTITTEASIVKKNGEWTIAQDELFRIIEQELEDQLSNLLTDRMEDENSEND